MEYQVDPLRKQTLDDTFDAFSMLARGNYVSLYDMKAKLTRYSPGAVELFGLPGEYIPDGVYDWADCIHPEDRRHYLAVMGKLISGETHAYDITYRVRTKEGGYGSFRFFGAVIRAAGGEPSLVGGMMVNQGLLDNTDPITVLPNKTAFFRDLPTLMRTDEKVVVLYLGLGGLSAVNETRGYSYGNRVLQQVCWTLQEMLAGRGSLYRMDDAAFAVVSARMSENEAAALYDSARLKLQRGVPIEGARVSLSCSAGLIATRGQLLDAGAVHSCVTYACRASRDEKHGELVDFNGTTSFSSPDALELVSRIREAVLDGCRGFSLKYQPLVGREGRPVGAEALLRWQDAQFGEVSPAEFLPLLEHDFVFEELTHWILRRAMEDGVRLLERSPDFLLGFNLSVAQLEDEYFTDELLRILKQTGFPAGSLAAELTRGCRLMDAKRLAELTDGLRAQGIRVVIDDFGSGADSFAFLKALRPELVKLDLEFARDLETSEAAREAVRGLCAIASAYGASVCVKGVDTEEKRRLLAAMPVAYTQGHLYSAPVRLEELLALLKAPK